MKAALGSHEFGAESTYMLRCAAWMWVPSVGVRRMSDNLTNYDFGTLDTEVARGVPRYTPGTAVVPSLGITATRPLGAGTSSVA